MTLSTQGGGGVFCHTRRQTLLKDVQHMYVCVIVYIYVCEIRGEREWVYVCTAGNMSLTISVASPL